MDTMIKEWIQRDFIYIVVCLFAILSCIYTIYTVGDYKEKCDTFLLDTLEHCDCIDCYLPNETPQFNENYTLFPMFENDNYNKDQNT